MHDSDATVLAECTRACAQDLFAAYSVALTPTNEHPSSTRPGDVAAFIGFAGDRMCGTLTIRAPATLLAASYPIDRAGLRDPDEVELLDWWAELGNQLLGRIKNRLAPSGVDFHATTPKALAADRVRIPDKAGVTVCGMRLGVGDAIVAVWLDVAVHGDAVLFDSWTADAEAAAEGEVVLF
jgi:hypothetical protein